MRQEREGEDAGFPDQALSVIATAAMCAGHVSSYTVSFRDMPGACTSNQLAVVVRA